MDFAEEETGELAGASQAHLDGRRLQPLTTQVLLEVGERLLDEVPERHAGTLPQRDGPSTCRHDTATRSAKGIGAATERIVRAGRNGPDHPRGIVPVELIVGDHVLVLPPSSRCTRATPEFGSLPAGPRSTVLPVAKHRCDTKCKGSQNLIDRFARMGLTIIPRGAHDATIRGRVWPGRDRFVARALPALRAHWKEVVAILNAPALT